MSATEAQDEIHSNDRLESDEVAGLELPPVVTRTRSGRRVRTPSALLDPEVITLTKTPTRRTRKSVIQETQNVCDTLNKAERQASQPCTEDGRSESMAISNISEVEATDQVTFARTKASTPIPQHVLSTDGPDNSVDVKADNNTEKENQGILNVTLDVGCIPHGGSKKRTHSESSVKQAPMIPLGKPKSGRVWKDRNKQRFSAVLKDKPLRTSWEKKMEVKREKELVKKYHQQLKEEKAREKQEKRQRREENLKRRAENERKAEIVQVIRNTAKIKRMKKKQLRKIEKRDTLPMIQKSQPSNGKLAGKPPKGD